MSWNEKKKRKVLFQNWGSDCKGGLKQPKFFNTKSRTDIVQCSVRFHHETGDGSIPSASPRHHSTDERCNANTKTVWRKASHRLLRTRKLTTIIEIRIVSPQNLHKSILYKIIFQFPPGSVIERNSSGHVVGYSGSLVAQFDWLSKRLGFE